MIPELRQHQKEACRFSWNLFEDGVRGFALFMEQGTGKTKVILELASYLYKGNKIDTLLVFTPNSGKDQWVEEQVPLHCKVESQDRTPFIWEGKTTKKVNETFSKVVTSQDKLKIFSVNIESLQADTIDFYIKMIVKHSKGLFVVVDESTKIKNGRRKPTRGKRAGAKRTNKLLDWFSSRDCYKAILTGTPTPKNPFDLWSQFEFLKKNFFNLDYFFFTHKYGIIIKHSTLKGGKNYHQVLSLKEYNILKNELKRRGRITPQTVMEISCKYNMKPEDIIKINKMEKYYPYKNLKELKENISRITFFVKKSDCLDLPPKIYETLKVTLKGEQKRIYKELKKQFYVEYAGKELTVTNKMVLGMRLQSVTGGLFPIQNSDGSYSFTYIENNGKLEVLLEDLEEVSEDTYIITWARFRAEIELIEKTLKEEGYTCEKYYGGSDNEVIDRFKKGEFQILVATTGKGGEGLNLQIATLHYFFSNSFEGDKRLQAEDRSHRDGQTNKVLYKDIICKDTIDESIVSVLKRKENLIDYFREKPLEEVIF